MAEIGDMLKKHIVELLLALTRSQQPIEGVMHYTLLSGRELEIPMGRLDPDDIAIAEQVAVTTKGCSCPTCSLYVRVAIGMREDVWELPLGDAREIFAKEVTDNDMDGILRAVRQWFKDNAPADREIGDLPDIQVMGLVEFLAQQAPQLVDNIKQLTEGNGPNDMTVQATAAAAAVKKSGEVKKQEPTVEFKDVKIVREGQRIILPAEMTYEQGREWLTKQEKDEESVVAINETIEVFPLEGALAFAKALDRKFGYIEKVGSGFFSMNPPQMVGLTTGFEKTTQVPWGRVNIPGIDGFLQTTLGWTDTWRPVFSITGNVKQKHKVIVNEVIELTKKIAHEESIYKGQAITMHFPNQDDGEQWTPMTAPKFMDLRQVRPEELIFPKATARLVNDALFTPIRKTQRCRDNQIPLKRGILLEGPPGCGKTLTAGVTALECVNNGWTFIYLDDVADIAQAIHFAKQYQPAVIFAEDFDREVNGERDEDIDGILNTLDGVDTKGTELMVVVTTNYVKKITREAIRPGRLDAVISVQAPDGEAAERLVRLYARGLVAANANLHEVGKALQGQIPAVIREVVERSKLSAIARTENDIDLQLEPQDLTTTAAGMIAHLALLNAVPEEEASALKVVGDTLGTAIVGGIRHAVELSKGIQPNGKHSAPAASA